MLVRTYSYCVNFFGSILVNQIERYLFLINPRDVHKKTY